MMDTIEHRYARARLHQVIVQEVLDVVRHPPLARSPCPSSTANLLRRSASTYSRLWCSPLLCDSRLLSGCALGGTVTTGPDSTSSVVTATAATATRVRHAYWDATASTHK